MFPQPPRPAFINDLIPLILESNDHWWPRDLIRLAQVSSGWLWPARRRLFALPSLRSFHSFSQIAQTLSENRLLLSLVKGIELRPMSESGQYVSSDEMNSLKYILAIEGLQDITFGGLLAVKAERFLRVVVDAKSVLKLHIDGSLLCDSLTHYPSLEWDDSLAARFHYLRRLRLTHIELDILPPLTTYNLQLSNLHLHHVNIMNGHMSHMLPTSNALDHLSIRSTQASDCIQDVKLILNTCVVETLEVDVETDRPLHHSLFDNELPGLLMLRCLYLNGVYIDLDALNYITHKCCNLEVLVVSGRMVTVLPCEWVSLITTRCLTRLRGLGLPWGTNHPPYLRWCGSAVDAINEAAVQHHIDILPVGSKS